MFRICFIITLILFQPFLLFAEIREVYGLKLEQGEVTKLDSQLLRVELFGEQQIISEGQLINHLINRNFARADVVFSLEQLELFAEQALSENNFEALVAAFNKIASSNPQNLEDLYPLSKLIQKSAFFDYLIANPGTILNSNNYDSLFWQNIFWSLFAHSYPNSAAERLILNKFKFNPELLAKILEYQLLVELNDSVNPLEALKKLQRSFALSNTLTQQNLQAFLSYYRELSESRDFLPNLNRIIREHPRYFERTEESIRQFIYKEINQQIREQKNFKLAFDLLLTIEFDKRSEREHELVLRIVEALTMDQAVLLLLEPYQRSLRMFANKDPRIKDSLIRKIQQVLEFYYANNDPLGADDYLKNLQNLSGEDVQTQSYILRHINLLEGKGLKVQATEYYNKISAKISLVNKIKYYFRDALTLFVSFFLAVAIFAFLIRLYLKKRKIFEGQNKTKINGRLSPRYQRFSALLSYFDVSREANIAEIKKAYRAKVKNLHPDLNPNQEDSQNREFMEVTEKYEELLKLLDEISKEESTLNSGEN